MHAVTVVDGDVEWREHPDPTPGEGELLVAVRAAGLNGADMLQRRGLYAAPPGSPIDIPGLELAGEVVAVGANVTRFTTGDRVMAIVGGGGQAELAVVHERVALPIPDRLTWVEAGGFPEVFTTAHDALFTQCGLTLGEAVLVHGAAGGVGIAGVQLAACAGARVTATVRTADLHDEVAAIGRACGAVDVCDPADFIPRGPFDVILELVGAPNLPDDLTALAVGGQRRGHRRRRRRGRLDRPPDADGRRGRIHASTLRADRWRTRRPPRGGRALRAPVGDKRSHPRAGGGRVRHGRRGHGLRAVRGGWQARQARARRRDLSRTRRRPARVGRDPARPLVHHKHADPRWLVRGIDRERHLLVEPDEPHDLVVADVVGCRVLRQLVDPLDDHGVAHAGEAQPEVPLVSLDRSVREPNALG